MRKREIMQRVAEVERRLEERQQFRTNVGKRLEILDKMLANADLLKVDELMRKIDWMHERIDLLANRVDKLRGRPRAQPADWMPDYRSTLVRAERQRAKAKRKPKAKARRRVA